MIYRVYVEETYYGHVEVEAESFEQAMERAPDHFDSAVANSAGPVPLTVEKRQIRGGKLEWVGA